MKSLLNRALAATMMVVPASLNPENQYAKSFAAVLCLAVSADKQFEPDEFQQACEFIEQDQFLRTEGLTVRTIEFFKAYCKSIQEVMTVNSIDFPSVQSELIAEARDVPMEYKAKLVQLIQTLKPICSQEEQKVLNRINL